MSGSLPISRSAPKRSAATGCKAADPGQGEDMMTNEEIERRLTLLSENQIVQGELLNRIEQTVARNAEAIANSREAIERNSEAIGRLADRMLGMVSAMERLFEHMDRFIRGLGSNGQKLRGDA